MLAKMHMGILFTILAPSLGFNQTQTSYVIREIIEYSFEATYCICVINGRNTISNTVEQALLETNIPVLSFSYETLASYDELSWCYGYIIAGVNESFSEDTSLFKPHTRVIFFGDRQDSSTALKYLANTKAIDVIAVNGVQQNLQNIFHSNLTAMRDLRVISVSTNTTLFAWNCHDFKISRQNFVQSKWTPQFTPESPFKVSAFHCPPYVLHDPSRGVYDGLEYRIIKAFTKELNLTLEFIVKPDKVTSPDSWQMVVDDVVKEYSHLATCSHWQLSISTVRTDMSRPYGQSCPTFLVPKPQVLPISTYVFQPFQARVWITIATVMFCLTVLVHVMARCYKIMGREQHPYATAPLAILDVLQLCSVGTSRYFPTLSGHVHLRFILAVASMQALLLYTAYSSGYEGLSLFPRYSNPIKSFGDMVKQKICWDQENGSLKQFLQNSTNPVLNKLATVHASEKPCASIRKENHAILVKSLDIGDTIIPETLDDYDKAHLKVLPECVVTNYIVFPLNKNSPLTSIFNRYLLIFLEHGLIEYWYTEVRKENSMPYMPQFYTFYVKAMGFKPPLPIEKVRGGLYLLLIGHTLALLTFVVEVSIYTFCKRKNKQRETKQRA